MSQLIRLRDIQATNPTLLGADYFDPTGKTAYGIGGDKIGRVDGALVEADTGRVRYFIVDAGGWFTSKEVLVPAGLARIAGDEVFFDTLTKEQVEAMELYDTDYNYSYQEQQVKDKVAFTAPTTAVELNDAHYNAPNTLELLEERLRVNKETVVAGLVSIGKRVVTEEQRVEVELQEEHAHIERTAVNRPTTRQIGDDGVSSIEVELQAERANVAKETYVTEEVSLGKTTTAHTETIIETIQREELNIDEHGNVIDRHGNVVTHDGITADDVRRARGL